MQLPRHALPLRFDGIIVDFDRVGLRCGKLETNIAAVLGFSEEPKLRTTATAEIWSGMNRLKPLASFNVALSPRRRPCWPDRVSSVVALSVKGTAPIPSTATRLTKTLSIILCVLIAIACLAVQANAKDEFRYDWGKCKTDVRGDVYVAFGDRVLRFPWSDSRIYFIDSLSPNEQRTPPDSSEEVGCQGNPLQVRMFGALTGSLWIVKDDEPVTPITLYWNWRPRAHTDAKNSVWRGEDIGLDMLRLMCERATTTEILLNGLKACRLKPTNPPDARVEDWAANYSTDPNTYATPLGHPLVARCGPTIFSTPIDDCQVAYAITTELGVAYRFHPYHGAHPFPLDKLLSFDRSLQEHISAATVHDYKWPGPLKIDPGSDR